MDYYTQLVTASTGLPITVQEAQDQLYLHGTLDSDTLRDLTSKIKAATEYVERQTPGRYYGLRQTHDVILPEFPANAFDVPLRPLDSVTHIKYYAAAGSTLTTFGSTNYIVHTPTEEPGSIEIKPDESWPATRERGDAVQVRCVVGSTAVSLVPHTFKQAVKLTLGWMWRNRGDEGEPPKELQAALRSLLQCNNPGIYP